MSGDDGGEDASSPAGLEDYENMTVDDCLDALEDAPTDDVAAFLAWEREHKDRKTLVQPLERRLESVDTAEDNEDDDGDGQTDEQDGVPAVSDVGHLDADETDDESRATEDPSPFAEVAAEGPDAQASQPGAAESTPAETQGEAATDPLGDLADELEDEDWSSDLDPEAGADNGSDSVASDADDTGAAALDPGGVDVGLADDATDADGNTADAGDDGADDADGPRIDPDAPLGELADELSREGEAASTPEDDPFEEVDVGELDAEEVWEEVVEGDGVDEPAPGAGVGPASAGEDLPEHIVDKHEYCQRCPHFAEPPESTCTHEGTEIVEVVDSDHFRVRNCPIVKEAEFGPSPE